MALDLDLLDAQLQAAGIDPLVAAKRYAARVSLAPQPAGGGAAAQPARVSLATSKEAPAAPGPLSQPLPTVTRPMVSLMPPPAKPLGNPADPAVQSARASLVRRGRHPGSGPQDDAVQASGDQFLSRGGMTPDSSARGSTPTVSADTTNSSAAAARILSAANDAVKQGVTATSPTEEEEYRDLLKQEPTRAQFPSAKLPVWKKILGAAAVGAAGFGGPESAKNAYNEIFVAPERRAEQQFDQAHQTWEGHLGNILKVAQLHHQELEDRNLQSEIGTRGGAKTERPENLDREAYDYYVGQGMTPADARKRVLQDAQDVKPDRITHTSPFEAFAYGDPQEKKAAQDYLEFERKMGARYERPSEFDERYRLFKEDPETYKAMFGDKSGERPDRGTATKMLNYFDRRRREIQNDFTLDDQQKAQQLEDIAGLEKPFMDAVQPNNGGNNEDRVTVTSPDGRVGTVPRSQLDKAKKKGYRVSQ